MPPRPIRPSTRYFPPRVTPTSGSPALGTAVGLSLSISCIAKRSEPPRHEEHKDSDKPYPNFVSFVSPWLVSGRARRNQKREPPPSRGVYPISPPHRSTVIRQK